MSNRSLNVLGVENSLINQYISEIRDKEIQKDSLRFRRNLERIGEIFAYEISKTLQYDEKSIQTPLGIANVPVLAKQPVIATIMRAGLPLHQGLLNYFDKAQNAFISAYRKYEKDGTFHIQFEHISAPDINDKIIILSDPMLATGASMVLSYLAMLEKGKPKHAHIISIIASREGIDYIQKKTNNKNVTIWVGAIDDELTVKSYIVPGLGDAGDLAYGEKS
ncbi:MAG: uracil phosphoribosyltransferase [Chlorobi bacterium]|nr:uracil phosphoribosyltransferase [Chlorobiota bacterium]